MKFATKLSLAVTLLLAAALALVGYVLVRQNFSASLNAAIQQNLAQHQFERFSLQSELLDIQTSGDVPEQLLRYGATLDTYFGDGRRMVAFYDAQMAELFSNFPADLPGSIRHAALGQEGEQYILQRVGDAVYMLVASDVPGLGGTWRLLSGYDISHIFAQRDTQLKNLWLIGGGVLLASAFAAAILAHLLTRPIRRLNRASRQIASGAYHVRTANTSLDEIGELSRNFNTMATAIEERVDALKHSVAQRDDFVSAFTHEIKTPMTSIIGYSDIVRSMQCDEKTRHTAANHIFHEAKRLEALSQKLLRLMGLSREEPVLVPTPVEGIFAAAWRSLLPLPAGIDLRFEPCPAVVLADRDLAADLLRNLLLNAFAAAPANGRVRVHAQVQTGRCHIAVQDAGRGIPAEELARITEPFYMVDKSRARAAGGTGIGLALCVRIAQAHGTTLQFQSTLGKGTTVSFSLELGPQEDRLFPKAKEDTP